MRRRRKTPITEEAEVVIAGGWQAGVAAALAVKRSIQPRKLYPKKVIEALIKQGLDNLPH